MLNISRQPLHSEIVWPWRSAANRNSRHSQGKCGHRAQNLRFSRKICVFHVLRSRIFELCGVRCHVIQPPVNTVETGGMRCQEPAICYDHWHRFCRNHTPYMPQPSRMRDSHRVGSQMIAIRLQPLVNGWGTFSPSFLAVNLSVI